MPKNSRVPVKPSNPSSTPSTALSSIPRLDPNGSLHGASTEALLLHALTQSNEPNLGAALMGSIMTELEALAAVLGQGEETEATGRLVDTIAIRARVAYELLKREA